MNRIVQLLFFHIGLADQNNVGAALGIEETFHGGECNGLMLSYELAAAISSWKKLNEGSEESCRNTESKKQPPIVGLLSRQHVVGSDGSHEKCSGDTSAEHVVQVLPERPFVRQKRPETRQARCAVGT